MRASHRFGQIGLLGLVVLATAIVTGCASLSARDRADRLEQAMRAYDKAIRWGEFAAAESVVRPRTPPENPVTPADLDGIRVTSFKYVLQQPAPDAPEEVNAVAAIDAYRVNSGVVFSVTQRQRWYFDEESKSWFLDGTLPPLNQPPQ